MTKLLILICLSIGLNLLQAKEPKDMSLLELEGYLLPPIGTERDMVESYFGYPASEVEANSGEKRTVYGYLLFLPIVLDIVYTDGKITERAFHHRENIADWNSNYFWDVAIPLNEPDKPDKAANTKNWIRTGYLHFLQGRKLIRESSSPPWQKTTGEQGAAGNPLPVE